MESTKYLNNISDKLSNCIKKDIQCIIDKILSNYDIYIKNTDKQITKEQLINKLMSMDRCRYISDNGKVCLHKNSQNTKYCKIHLTKSINRSILQKSEPVTKKEMLLIQTKNKTGIKTGNKKLNKKFIKDTLYYVDDNFIYDPDTLDKVGYISSDGDNQSENESFILTDDPFVLGII